MRGLKLPQMILVILLLVVSTLHGQERLEPMRQMVEGSGGVELLTDTYLPEEEGKWPVVLIRTPYGGDQMHVIARYFVDAGYAVVVQNVRGMGGSKGNFIPFVYEKTDGVASLEWISNQPWCDGRIGAWGESYLGYSALMLTTSGHPALKAVVNISGMGDLNWFMAPGGAMHLMAHFPWLYSYMGGGKMVPWEEWMQMFKTLPAGRLFAPPGSSPEAGIGAAAAMANMFRGLEKDYEKVAVPILHISGWQDYVYQSTLRTYEGIAAAADVKQSLIMGPWQHQKVFSGESTVGGLDFGENADRPYAEKMQLAIEWFDRYVRGDDSAPQVPPVRIFINERNQWVDFEQWPPAEVQSVNYYCWPAEQGNTGYLSLQKPTANSTMSFVYDPEDPVPTLGGDVFHGFRDKAGYRDHAALLKRDDVLSFTTEVLTEPLTIVGNLEAEVWLQSEGPDTDVTAWITIVRPDGRVDLIEEGITRASAARIGDGEGLKPDTPYLFTVDCGASAWQIPEGSRLQLLISSSNFPKYVRNPNTGVEPMAATELKAVRQTLHISPEKASRLILPVLQK